MISTSQFKFMVENLDNVNTQKIEVLTKFTKLNKEQSDHLVEVIIKAIQEVSIPYFICK